MLAEKLQKDALAKKEAIRRQKEALAIKFQ
jgi:hypothetical protein